jgi:hypothetical protein
MDFNQKRINNGTMKTKKTGITTFISIFFILLFCYAAISKIMDFEKFQIQIKDSPLLIQKASKSDMFMKQRDFSAYWSENLTKLLQDKEGYVADNVVAWRR